MIRRHGLGVVKFSAGLDEVGFYPIHVHVHDRPGREDHDPAHILVEKQEPPGRQPQHALDYHPGNFKDQPHR